MSFLFSLTSIIKKGLENMLREVQMASVRVLAQHFKFDVDEAMRILDSNGEPAVVPEYIPLEALPWINVVKDENCQAISFNKGLYTQCNGKKSGNYCKKCAAQHEKNGTLPYGDVTARQQCDPMEYLKVRPFMSIMEKNGWSEQHVKDSVAHYGGTIHEDNFDKKKRSRRGRPANAAMAAPPIPIEPVQEPDPEPVQKSESESESESESDAELTREGIMQMTKQELIAECEKRGIETKAGGKPRKVAEVRNELIERFVSE